jgi:hypothetical protein
LYGNIQPIDRIGFCFGYDGTIFGVGLKGFGGYETLTNAGDTKVRVPKNAQKGQQGEEAFDEYSTDIIGIIGNC